MRIIVPLNYNLLFLLTICLLGTLPLFAQIANYEEQSVWEDGESGIIPISTGNEEISSLDPSVALDNNKRQVESLVATISDRPFSVNRKNINKSLAPPSNDNACNATMLTLGQATLGTFIEATVEENEPYAPGKDCAVNWCDTILHGSVWYKFLAPATSAVTIIVNAQTDHSDTKIALYSGINCQLSTPFQNVAFLDANDDKPGDCCDGSVIALACLTPNQAYYIQVEQYHQLQNDFEVIVNALETCELACDLSFADDLKIEQDSCDGNGGFISLKIISPSGQLFSEELTDTFGTPVPITGHGGSFFQVPYGFYRVKATSSEAENCYIESGNLEVKQALTENCVPGCDALNLMLHGNTLSGEYKAANSISTDGETIISQTTVFKAGNSITLKPGFQVNSGTDFLATIEDCSATLTETLKEELARITLSITPAIVEASSLTVYPNPFSTNATINYYLPTTGKVDLQVLDFMGRQVAVLEQGVVRAAGQYQVIFQPDQLANGTYFVLLQSGEYFEIQKLMLLQN